MSCFTEELKITNYKLWQWYFANDYIAIDFRPILYCYWTELLSSALSIICILNQFNISLFFQICQQWSESTMTGWKRKWSEDKIYVDCKEYLCDAVMTHCEGQLTTLDLILYAMLNNMGSGIIVISTSHTTSKDYIYRCTDCQSRSTKENKLPKCMINDKHTDLTPLHAAHVSIFHFHAQISWTADGFDTKIISSMNESIN